MNTDTPTNSSSTETVCPESEALLCLPPAREEEGRQGGAARLDDHVLCSDGEDCMALPVTRHASTPPDDQFRFLLCGIDTLDLGLYVSWGIGWKRRLIDLDRKKQRARKKGGLVITMPSGRQCVFLPGGKGQNYRYHIQFEAYNLFIGKAVKPGLTPNVYLSINSKTLWLSGTEKALSWIAEDLKAIGNGSIQTVKVSRVDLCADFWIPGGLSLEFILSHKVTHSDKGKLFLGRDELETCYIGDANSPIQLRVYHKGLEVRQQGTKLWFLDLWKAESTEDIWRFEFQLRRQALKQFGINSMEDLKEKQSGVWGYLTSKFFCLRLPTNEKAERRPIHPLWKAVQKCFGENPHELARDYGSAEGISPQWHLSHIDGCLSSFAALLGITDREEALAELGKQLKRRNNADGFKEACIKKAIQKGTLTDGGSL